MADLGIRYATALFEMSNESGTLGDYLNQAQFLMRTLTEEDALSILVHPRISANEKYAFLTKTYEGQVDTTLFNFMKLVVSKNREAFLVPALTKLVEMIREHNNQTTAKVVSAIPLTDEQAADLTGVLSKRLGKQVDVTVLVDPSVIAGISIHVDGYFLDRTVRTMLKDLKETVKRGADE